MSNGTYEVCEVEVSIIPEIQFCGDSAKIATYGMQDNHALFAVRVSFNKWFVVRQVIQSGKDVVVDFVWKAEDKRT